RVRHEQVATFGSIALPMTVEGRDAFWQRLHETLARLDNRIDPAAAAKLMGDVHARIPMVTADERTAAAIAVAEEDERVWTGVQGMFAGIGTGMAEVAAKASADGNDACQRAAEAAKHVTEAQDRIARLRRGEVVAPSQAIDPERVLRDVGWTTGDLNHAR